MRRMLVAAIFLGKANTLTVVSESYAARGHTLGSRPPRPSWSRVPETRLAADDLQPRTTHATSSSRARRRVPRNPSAARVRAARSRAHRGRCRSRSQDRHHPVQERRPAHGRGQGVRPRQGLLRHGRRGRDQDRVGRHRAAILEHDLRSHSRRRRTLIRRTRRDHASQRDTPTERVGGTRFAVPDGRAHEPDQVDGRSTVST